MKQSKPQEKKKEKKVRKAVICDFKLVNIIRVIGCN